MQLDIIMFQSAIAISLLIFFAPMKVKYFTFLLPILVLMGVTSTWAINVIGEHQFFHQGLRCLRRGERR